MNNIEKLIGIVKQFKLIESSDDIDFLFVNLEFNEEEDLDSLIEKALVWGHVNDEFEDFFLEHWDVLVDTDLVTNIKDCSITDNEMYITNITLSKFSSKSKYYYKIDASGINEDMFETHSFYSIEDYEDDENQIQKFKDDCILAYTCHGDFTEKEMLENGSTIVFSD